VSDVTVVPNDGTLCGERRESISELCADLRLLDLDVILEEAVRTAAPSPGTR